MTSALRLSTQSSLFTAWQLGQLRLRQELLWNSVCPQSGQMLTLQPNAPVLHRRMTWQPFSGCGTEDKRNSIPAIQTRNLLDLTLCHKYLPSYQEDL